MLGVCARGAALVAEEFVWRSADREEWWAPDAQEQAWAHSHVVRYAHAAHLARVAHRTQTVLCHSETGRAGVVGNPPRKIMEQF